MICPTCNAHPMVHPKKTGPTGPFTLTCTGCKKAPETCTCEFVYGMDAHIVEALK